MENAPFLSAEHREEALTELAKSQRLVESIRKKIQVIDAKTKIIRETSVANEATTREGAEQ